MNSRKKIREFVLLEKSTPRKIHASLRLNSHDLKVFFANGSRYAIRSMPQCNYSQVA